MKAGKRILCSLLAVCVCVAAPMVVFAASESIDGGSGSWYGGIDDNQKIYSKVWDHKVDGRRYTVTVWVADDNGDKDSVTGTTNGVNDEGEVKVTKTASHDHIFIPNKAGYKDLSIVTSRSGITNTQVMPGKFT